MTQVAEEVHIVPLPDAEEDDKRLSNPHHAYDKSDLWPWTQWNTALLADATPESTSSSVDDKVDPDAVVDIGPSNSALVDMAMESLKQEDAPTSSHPLEMTTPSSSLNGDGTKHKDSQVNIMASDDSEEAPYAEQYDEHESGTGQGGSVSRETPSPASSDVLEMLGFPQARNSTLSLERHGGIGSLVAR